MFDKKAFSEILKKIYSSYKNQREFANALNFNRAHLFEYMNGKVDSPPKPQSLEKIAEGSNGITTYDELMEICGYKKMINGYNLLITGNLKYLDLLFEGEMLSDEQKIIELQKIVDRLNFYIKVCEDRLKILDEIEICNIIKEDSIISLGNDIRITNKKIKGFQTLINKLNKKINH